MRMKTFIAGLLVGVLLLVSGAYYYFASGMAPVAVSDPMMPFEKAMASKALNARIDKEKLPPSPVPADEPNLLAGAKIYKNNCAGCHGLPDQAPPLIAGSMFPHATLLFKGKGVTDDPASESYWKAANGIRLSGMPSFKESLTDTQLWQVAQLVAHADQIPDSARKALAPEPPAETPIPIPAPTTAFPSKQKQ
jgi:mono/diheme cytochrome c family protein